jgi:hypothetical protein
MLQFLLLFCCFLLPLITASIKEANIVRSSSPAFSCSHVIVVIKLRTTRLTRGGGCPYFSL